MSCHPSLMQGSFRIVCQNKLHFINIISSLSRFFFYEHSYSHGQLGRRRIIVNSSLPLSTSHKQRQFNCTKECLYTRSIVGLDWVLLGSGIMIISIKVSQKTIFAVILKYFLIKPIPFIYHFRYLTSI